jgi:hypothetical protein
MSSFAPLLVCVVEIWTLCMVRLPFKCQHIHADHLGRVSCIIHTHRSVSWLEYGFTVWFLPCPQSVLLLHLRVSLLPVGLWPCGLCFCMTFYFRMIYLCRPVFIQALAHSRLLGGCLAACFHTG